MAFVLLATATRPDKIPHEIKRGSQCFHAKSVTVLSDGLFQSPFHSLGVGMTPNIQKMKTIVTPPKRRKRLRREEGSNPLIPLRRRVKVAAPVTPRATK